MRAYFLVLLAWSSVPVGHAALLRGEILDGQGNPVAARLYVQDIDGRHFPVGSAGGKAVFYGRTNWLNSQSIETHTTLSPHPFEATLPSGRYRLLAERGHEYLAAEEVLELTDTGASARLVLRRWIDMAGRGWFSGDTHVHRSLDELPNVLLAEDLNVAFPLVYWVTKAYTPPSLGDKTLPGDIPSEVIEVDRTHLIWPRNTEWEIFTVGGKRHTLGAVFALGHRTPIEAGAPPVGPIAAEARRQGALLDLDKHNWPWSMAIIPAMKIDLYELANNHIWRAAFAFTNWATPSPDWMTGQRSGEAAWIEFTWQNYYVLLNCGFRLRPTAGTANGVHPVPLGFGRVYVRCPDGFDYPRWFRGLDAGRSFVTTGPMLLASFNEQDPGTRFLREDPAPFTVQVSGQMLSQGPGARVELIRNGRLLKTFPLQNHRTEEGAWETRFNAAVALDDSGWLAVRGWEERADGRRRYAHTAPVFVDWPDRPSAPPRRDAEFLVRNIREEVARSQEILSPEAMAEYREALAVCEEILSKARD